MFEFAHGHKYQEGREREREREVGGSRQRTLADWTWAKRKNNWTGHRDRATSDLWNYFDFNLNRRHFVTLSHQFFVTRWRISGVTSRKNTIDFVFRLTHALLVLRFQNSLSSCLHVPLELCSEIGARHFNVQEKSGGNMLIKKDHGGGQVVRVLAFDSDELSSNPSESNGFSVKLVFEKNEKRPGLAHF